MILATQNQPQLIKNCHRCGRNLTHPVSMYVGFGPVCSEYLGVDRPKYDELMKLNPEIQENLDKLFAIRLSMEAKWEELKK